MVTIINTKNINNIMRFVQVLEHHSRINKIPFCIITVASISKNKLNFYLEKKETLKFNYNIAFLDIYHN